MISLGQIGKTAGILLGTAAGIAGVGALAALRRPLPRTSGTLPLPGLEAPVQVMRDRWGVPHIYARSSADLFTAQGYCHAQDRLWQMEFQRRVAYGQLAELFGAVALDSDRFVRVLGLSRVARRESELLSDGARQAAECYVRGVNTYIEQHGGNLPVEFTILRIRPRAWEVADILAWAKIMALSLSENWKQELLRARIVAAAGEERAAAVEPPYPDDHPLIVPNGARYHADMGADALGRAAATRRYMADGAGQGSNSWAVSGARSASGAALLANDPHLPLQVPSIWYENHLSGGEYHVTGASLPGAPGVVIGHNEHIAWGMTNSTVDVQDLYQERFDPNDPTGLRYEFRGEWERAELIREEIVVRGMREVVIEEVRVTRHGPVISPLAPHGSETRGQDELPLALRWTSLDPATPLENFLRLNRAHNWQSFRQAIADVNLPPQNFTYADVEGHIGYALAGRVPVRAAGDGRLPAPGWTGEYEWTGYAPPEELPHALDPDDGIVVTANNRIVSEEIGPTLPGEWCNGYRAARIDELLRQIRAHDGESFSQIMADVRSIPGLQIAALAGRLPAATPLAEQARDSLAAWDGELTAGSVAGTIYSRLRARLLAAAYADVAGALDIVAGLGAYMSLPGQDFLRRGLPHIIERVAQRDDGWLPGGRTWDELLAEAWAATLAELRAELGDDVSQWRYGRGHTLTLRHTLGALPALASIFNRGPFPTGGDEDTVMVGIAPREYAGSPFYVGPSYRQICDTGDWDRSQSIHPVGQSGHPGSFHYADYVQPWLNNQYHPMPWSRTRVEEVAISRMTLAPGKR
jgi:penicillin G amidase